MNNGYTSKHEKCKPKYLGEEKDEAVKLYPDFSIPVLPSTVQTSIY